MTSRTGTNVECSQPCFCCLVLSRTVHCKCISNLCACGRVVVFNYQAPCNAKSRNANITQALQACWPKKLGLIFMN